MNAHLILPLLTEGLELALVPVPLTLFLDHVIGGDRFGHRRYRLTATYLRLIIVVVAWLAKGGGRLLVFALRALIATFRGALSLLTSIRRTP